MERTANLILEPEIEQRIQQLAGVDGNVLITGPTGSGKSAVAHRIHALSARGKKGKPFIPQNCGAIPGELVESTLFGHVRGAFTSAHQDASGLVEAANGGTLFLDEIGDLPLPVQVKLLTLLQDRTYCPVGSTKPRESSFRLIAATNVDLVERCNQKLFREDLYHRINVFRLELHSLLKTQERARRIAEREVKRWPMSEERAAQTLSAVERLNRHPEAWPGNVRELLTFIERCTLLGDLVVAEEEARILTEWARWQRTEGTERLTTFAPSVSPSLADRGRYAGMIHELAEEGVRSKKAVSRRGSFELASRLLDVFPAPLSLDEVQEALEISERRTLTKNIAFLVKHGLVQESTGGIVAVWPPVTATVFGQHHGEWRHAGPGVILSLDRGERIRIELTSKLAGTLGVMLITHTRGCAMAPEVIVDGKELRASKTIGIELELKGRGGLEQLLLHVGSSGRRSGSLVEPLLAESIMPDSATLEQGRRMALAKWHEGWLSEHLFLHTSPP